MYDNRYIGIRLFAGYIYVKPYVGVIAIGGGSRQEMVPGTSDYIIRRNNAREVDR